MSTSMPMTMIKCFGMSWSCERFHSDEERQQALIQRLFAALTRYFLVPLRWRNVLPQTGFGTTGVELFWDGPN